VLGSNDKADLPAIAPIGRHHCIWTKVIHKPIDVGAAFLAWQNQKRFRFRQVSFGSIYLYRPGMPATVNY